MRRVYQVAAVFLIALGAYMALEASRITLYTELGPGPGFFPFWMGIVFVLLSAGWLVQVSLQPLGPIEKGFFPDGAGAVRVLAILGSLLFYALLLEALGFRVAMLVFLFFLLTVLGRQKLMVSIPTTLLVSFGVYYVFTRWLDVPLPRASVELLKSLGL